MISRQTFIVFIVPIFFSFVFGYVVLEDILQKPGRELDLWPLSSGFSEHGPETASLSDHDSAYVALNNLTSILENGVSEIK